MKSYFLKAPFWGLVLFALLSSSSNISNAQKVSEQPKTSVAAPKPKTALTFIQNQNQWDELVKYRAEIPSGYLFARQNFLQYSFYQKEHHHPHGSHDEDKEHESAFQKKDNESYNAHSFFVELVGGNKSPKIIPSAKHDTKYNYFLGNDPSKWASNVSAYSELTYKSIYEGIDMHLYLKENSLKYDFVVAPNRDASKIKMRYKYADKVFLQNGNLHIITSVNEVIEKAPYTYQIINGEKVEVSSKFVLRGNTVRFEFPEGYNKNYELIIDPELIFSTYSGSRADNFGNAATFDQDGNLYAVGIADGNGFPITSGAFQINYNGGDWDLAIMKYNATGTGLFYATYLGGGGTDVPSSAIVNSRGELVILGVTGSSDMPNLANSYDNTFNGGGSASTQAYNFSSSDIFVAKLNSTGSALMGFTYLGGDGVDGINREGDPLAVNYGDGVRAEVIVDGSDNVYIASTTRSDNFPLVNAHRSTFSGGQEGIAAKFSPDLGTLLWSTFVGGNNFDAAFGIQLSSTGDIYVTGGTESNDLSTHGASIDRTYNGGIDGFIVRYAPNFTWRGASYIGTANYDQSFYVDVDTNDDVYIFGQTRGRFPVIPNTTYNNPNGGQFIRKMSPNLNNTIVSTVIGSGTNGVEPDIAPTAFMVNSCGNVYLSGWGGILNNTNVASMPITANAIKSNTTGDDFYLMILSEDMQDLVFGSYFGSDQGAGEHVDGGTSRFDKETGTIYHAVCACRDNSNFPTTPGAWSRTNESSNCNNAAFKIELGVLRADFEAQNTSGSSVVRGCAPFPVEFVNQSVEGITYEWDFGGLGTSTEVNPGFVFNAPGTYEVRLIARNQFLCVKSDTAFLTLEVDSADFTISNDTIICRGNPVQLTATGGTDYAWSPTTGLSNPTIANPIATPDATTTYTLTVQNASGCRTDLSTTVTVLPELIPSFSFSPDDPCSSNPVVSFINASQNGTSYFWDFGNGQTSNLQDPPSQTYTVGTYEIKLVAFNANCNERDSVTQTLVVDENTFAFSSDTTICSGQSVELFATGGTSYEWSPATGLSNPDIGNPIASPTETTTYTVRAIGTNSSCVEQSEITVTVEPPLVTDFEIIPGNPCDTVPSIEIINNSLGATSFLWDFGNGQTSTAENPPNPSYTVGTYTIKLVTFNDNCDDKDSLEIDFTVPENSFVFSPDTTICFGQTVQLSVQGGTAYSWTPTTGLSDPTVGNPIASPTETTTYTVTVTGNGGCEVSKTITVEVGEELVPDFEIIQENICEDNPDVRIDNKSTGATSYFWDFGNGQTSTSANPNNPTYTQDGTYIVRLIIGNDDCIDSLTKEFDYFTNDFFVSPNATICFGDTIQLEAGEGDTYSWSPSAGLSNPNIANPTASPAETTTYTVSISAASGCVTTREVTVNVLPELRPDFDIRVVDRCDQLPLIEITNNSIGATSFFWDFGDGRTSTLRNPPPFIYDQEGFYDIKLRVENSQCQDSLIKEGNSIIDNRGEFLASIQMPDDQTICRTEGVTLNVVGGEEFLWTPATGLSDPTIRNPVATPTETTTYNVRISNVDGGCFTDSTVTVTVVDKLELDFDVSHSSECGAPATVVIRSNNSGEGEWLWDFGDGQTTDEVNVSEYTYTQAGTYTIRVLARNGVCDVEQTATITVDDVLPPNVITPNGDGINDTFVLDKANAGWKLEVYNRWGELVFSSEDYQNDWGKGAQPTMYHYYLTSPDGDTCRGWIQVLQ